jgi:aminopeptidase-like protein
MDNAESGSAEMKLDITPERRWEGVTPTPDPAIVRPSARPPERPGAAMIRLAGSLYPICRSITGNGVRETLDILGRRIPIARTEVLSGQRIYDWVVPQEWNIRGAYIARADGRHVVDFAESNLHVVQYSRPIDAVVPLAELRDHLHSLPEQPDWIPYRRAFWSDGWGFCLRHRELEALRDPAYRVVIDATLEDGHLTYGECVVPGATDRVVLISCHICHPSLANDNLSGLVVAAELARWLGSRAPRLTYRFLFVPGTIGSLIWLARNEPLLPRIDHGLVLSCLGDSGRITYKQSRRGDAAIDRIAAHVLHHDGQASEIRRFSPFGYDERQYCSPGFNLPVGSLTRTPHGEYPEYHSSADNLSLLRAESLEHSLEVLQRIVTVIEGDGVHQNLSPRGEPQLGRRGLYPKVGGERALAERQMALLWVLNQADGGHSLLDTAERAGLPFAVVRAAADDLMQAGLLARVT